jgi:hypothetical protein
MPRIWPVMKAAASEQRKIAAPTRSSVPPTRPNGMRSVRAFLNAGSPRSMATCGVSTKVGEMAFTLIPWGAHSVAHWRVSELMAPFAAT